MKKILMLSLLSIVTIFVLVGCNNNNISDINSIEKEEIKELSEKTKVGNIDIDLSMTSSFNGLTYKYPKDALASNVGTYAIIDCMDKDDLIVRIALSFYPGKTIGDVIQGSNLSSVDVLEVNNTTWNKYEGMQEDGKKIINFVAQENGDGYSVAFISDKDIANFINEFMKNVAFNNK